MKSFIPSLGLMALFLISVTTINAQETETRNLESFTGIHVSSGIDATLVAGNSNKVEITASGIELDKVVTKVSGDRLKVGFDQKNNWKFWNNKKRKVEVTITYNSTLDFVSSTSGASVHANNTISSKNLKLNTSSGANMDISIEANKVNIDVSSGSRMDVSGNAKYVGIDISSGASLDASGLESAEVNVDGNSGSSAKVFATNKLTVDVNSGASVRYKGNPGNTDFDKNSGGSVKKI